MSKLGDKHIHVKKLKDREQDKKATLEIAEAKLIDQESEGISCRINNARIPISD